MEVSNYPLKRKESSPEVTKEVHIQFLLRDRGNWVWSGGGRKGRKKEGVWGGVQ